MILKKPLAESVDLFLSTLSKISNSDSAFGFTIETDVTVESSTNSTFYRIKDACNKSTMTIGLILGNKITEPLEIGKKYKVFGSLKLAIAAKSSGVFVNLVAEIVEPLEEILVENDDVLDLIKKFPIQRRRFPDVEVLKVFMICPIKDDAEATIDVESAIKSYGLENNIELTKKQCYITDAKSVANAVNQVPANTDVLIIARGGGEKFPIQMLDNELLAVALNKILCYKIIGTGHSSDRLAIEMLFDYVAAVPRDIVTHMALELEQRKELNELRYKVSGLNLAEKEKILDALKKDNDSLKLDINDYKIKYYNLLDASKIGQKKIHELQNEISIIKQEDANKNSSRNNVLFYKLGMVISFIIVILVCFLHFV